MGFMENIRKKQEDEQTAEIQSFLLADEQIVEKFHLMHDYCAITTWRLIYVDKQVLSSKKGVFSIPLQNITTASLSRGGFMSFTKDVEIMVGTRSFEVEFLDEDDAKNFYRAICQVMLASKLK